MWWGYRHLTGKVILKRYFSPADIDEAEKSGFVEDIFGPFEASDQEDAYVRLQNGLGNSGLF